jgi:hypothetical protein
MRNVLIAAAVVTLVSQISAQTPAPTAPRIDLTFEAGGTVTLTASGVTVRDILAEWTRKGGTPFVGAEKLPAAPVAVQFEHRPESEVIASLLRGASGFVVGPRRAGSTGASAFEVVYVLATSTASTATFSAPASTYVPPQPQISTPGSPDTEIPPVGPGRAGQPSPQQQDMPPASAPRPAGVSGVAVPVVPVVPVATPPPSGPGRSGGGGGGR